VSCAAHILFCSKRVLEVLLKMLPPNVTKHFDSHVSEVQNLEGQDGRPSRARLYVSAGQRHHHPDWPGEQSMFDADAVIGCDGVHSVIRNSLGLSDGANGAGRVRYTGTYAYRGLLDMEAAVKKEGEAMREPINWTAPNKVCFSVSLGKTRRLTLSPAHAGLSC
jgi:salicylate hydroxylase